MYQLEKKEPLPAAKKSFTEEYASKNEAFVPPAQSVFYPLPDAQPEWAAPHCPMPGKVLQKQAADSSPTRTNTGIPPALQSAFEARSGFSFDDVRVHYNASEPVQMRALAYTCGNQVFLGPGQERHLPHELGHVVQQKRGEVRPTKSVSGVSLNDSPAMEQDADRLSQGLPAVPTLLPRSLGETGHVVQKKDATAMVALRPMADAEVSADQVMVDTVKISGRFNTGLEGGSEGDHAISDVINKKYQKMMLRNQPVNHALSYYVNMLALLRTENLEILPDEVVSNVAACEESSQQMHEEALNTMAEVLSQTPGVTEADVVGRVLDADAGRIMKDEMVTQKAEEIVKRSEQELTHKEIMHHVKKELKIDPTYKKLKKADKQAEKARISSDPEKISKARILFYQRRNESNQLVEDTLQYIASNQGAKTLSRWRTTLENIVYNYNDALAKGVLTTSPLATGGAGEAAGKDSVRETARIQPVPELGGMSLDQYPMQSVTPDKAGEVAGMPNINQIVDFSSAKMLDVIVGGNHDVPSQLASKASIMTSHMKQKYTEKEQETQAYLKTCDYIPWQLNTSVMNDVKRIIRQADNVVWVGSKRLDSWLGDKAHCDTIIDQLSSKSLKILRELCWHSIPKVQQPSDETEFLA